MMLKSSTSWLNLFLNKPNLCMFVVRNERWVTENISLPTKPILRVKEIIHSKLNIFLCNSGRDLWNASYCGLHFAQLYWVKGIVQKCPHFAFHLGILVFPGPVLNLERRSLSLSLILDRDGNRQNRSVWNCFQQII